MTEKQIIDELTSIVTYCDLVKNKATGLRKKLERLNAPTSRKRAKIPEEEIARVLAGRAKHRYRKSEESRLQEMKEHDRQVYNAEKRVGYHFKKLQLLKDSDN